MLGLDTFREPAQRSDRPQPNGRVGGPEVGLDLTPRHIVSLA